jgi:hypothetical protein
MSQVSGDYANAISRCSDDLHRIFPEKTRGEVEALTAMAMDAAMQHGFNDHGFQAFQRLVQLES